MAGTRSPQHLISALVILALGLLILDPNMNQVSAQSLSAACNTCLTTQLGLLPTCAGVNLTNTAQQSTPQYHTCICDASFSFNWTLPCSGVSCQPAELTTFEGSFGTILQVLNQTCVKPTPSPTPTPTPTGTGKGNSAANTATIAGWVTMASILVVSMAAAGF